MAATRTTDPITIPATAPAPIVGEDCASLLEFLYKSPDSEVVVLGEEAGEICDPVVINEVEGVGVLEEAGPEDEPGYSVGVIVFDAVGVEVEVGVVEGPGPEDEPGFCVNDRVGELVAVGVGVGEVVAVGEGEGEVTKDPEGTTAQFPWQGTHEGSLVLTWLCEEFPI